MSDPTSNIRCQTRCEYGKTKLRFKGFRANRLAEVGVFGGGDRTAYSRQASGEFGWLRREYLLPESSPGNMQTLCQLAADVVVVVHFAFVAFVALGLLLTLVGGVRQWAWVRSFRFRGTHVAAIGVVVIESLCGITCPLTVWEQQLRVLAGQTSHRGDFIATWVHKLMFFEAEPWVFTTGYSAFGAMVVLSWLLVPPTWPRGVSAAKAILPN